MKKAIFIVLFFCCINNLFSQVERDKALHFLGGNLYGLAGAGIAKQISDGNRWWTFAGAIGGSALIGLGKEAVDAGQRENGWDNDDLWATILGGATVGVTIDIFTDHKKEKRKPKAITLLNQHEGLNQMERFNVLYSQQEIPSLIALSLPNELWETMDLE
jgi:uncharacterized protein YfiM (DUF2279 family)